ncbi:MAG: hypothetical protein LBR74_04855 [Eubacterium sp.]|jgi:hypothetical protein|nr:hypothetical protein [Eubacterium sp.]
MADNKQPTALQAQIIKLWADGLSSSAIAAHLSCSTESVRLVKKNSDFRKRFFELQRENVAELLPLAISRIKKILQDDDASAAVHASAARDVLERFNVREKDDTAESNINIKVSYE